MMRLLLLLHHSMCSTGPNHLPGPAVKASVVTLFVEEHGRPRLHAVGAHSWTTEHRQGSSVRGAADFIAAGDLDTQQV